MGDLTEPWAAYDTQPDPGCDPRCVADRARYTQTILNARRRCHIAVWPNGSSGGAGAGASPWARTEKDEDPGQDTPEHWISLFQNYSTLDGAHGWITRIFLISIAVAMLCMLGCCWHWFKLYVLRRLAALSRWMHACCLGRCAQRAYRRVRGSAYAQLAEEEEEEEEEGEEGEEVKTWGELLEQRSDALLMDERLPLSVRLLVPTMAVANIVIFLSGHLTLASDIDIGIGIAGQHVVLERFATFSLGSSLIDMWHAKTYALA